MQSRYRRAIVAGHGPDSWTSHYEVSAVRFVNVRTLLQTEETGCPGREASRTVDAARLLIRVMSRRPSQALAPGSRI